MSPPRTALEIESFPVGAAEIAKRLDVRPQTVHAWRHRNVMPQPRWTVSGQPAWDWAEIEVWAVETGRLEAPDTYRELGDLEGSGWSGDLDEMRASRTVGRA